MKLKVVLLASTLFIITLDLVSNVVARTTTTTTTSPCQAAGVAPCNRTTASVSPCRNCLNPSSCDASQGLCNDYQCALGYTGPPDCQTECPGSTFGSNCLLTCHCRPNDTCSAINGYCSRAECHPDWGGTACQMRLPKLTAAPEVGNITCSSLVVTWKPWSETTDIGAPGTIASYLLQRRVNATAETEAASGVVGWTPVGRALVVPAAAAGTESVVVVVDDPFSSLEFRVLTNWFNYGKVFAGLPSPSSSSLRPIVFCAVTTPGSVTTQRFQITTISFPSTNQTIGSTTCSISSSTLPTPTTTLLPTTVSTTASGVPGPVTSLVAFVQPQTSSIRFTWSAPVDLILGLTVYTLSYSIAGIGDCAAAAAAGPSTTVVQPATETTFTVYNAIPWRTYVFAVRANNVAGVGPAVSASVISQEIIPFGSVSNLSATDVSSRRISLAWDEVDCAERGGSLVAYEISLRDAGGGEGGGSVRNSNVTQRVVTFADLTPFTRYSATVRYVNGIGRGPISNELSATTTADVPSAPKSVLITFASEAVLQVTWSAPVSPNGIIQQYRVSYWRRGEESAVTQLAIPSSQSTCNITGLTPYTVYCVQVQGQTQADANDGWGNRTEVVCNRTTEGQSSAPTDLRVQPMNESCIEVQWRSPSTTNGVITTYRVQWQSKSSSASVPMQVIVPASQLTCSICSGLDPDTEYRVEVQARNSQGYGASVTADVWTEIGDPEQPPTPQVIGVEQTSASVRIGPAVLSHGPVAGYFVVVVSLLRSRPTRAAIRAALSLDPTRFIPLPGYTAAQLTRDDVRETMEFPVGDNKTYLGYRNRPLDSAALYTIYYVVASSRDGVLVKMNYSQTPTAFQTGGQATAVSRIPTPGPPSPAVPVSRATAWCLTTGQKVAIGILIPLAVLILLLLLLRCCWWWWWWKKRKNQPDEGDTTWLHYYTNNYMKPRKQNKKWNDIYSLDEPRRVVTGSRVGGGGGGGPEDIDVTDLNRIRHSISFEDEYRQLPVGLNFRCSEAEKPENENKNRFDHLAYDHTRVKLNDVTAAAAGTDPQGQGYYNANFIPGYDRRLRAYIAAQSPFNETTICDFWSMVYDQKVTKVVLMTRLLEDAVVKSEKYWSDDCMTHPYGHVTVTLNKTEMYANFVVRTFVVSSSSIRAREEEGGPRRVTQFQFTAWPDHGVPADPVPLLEFRRKVGSSPDAPLLVHCGTGVSRSAVYIAIDFCLAKAEAENCVNVYRCCSTMRQCRTMMVRTLKQYTFIYSALFDALIASHLVLDCDVKSVYDTLKKVNPSTNVTHFKHHFQLLERYVDDLPTKALCTIALSPQNIAKNRFATLRLVVKDVDVIPLRSPDGPTRLEYINALFLPSHTHRNAFIVTQSPLRSTVAAFWSLVLQQETRAIVSLSGRSFTADDASCAAYLPSVFRTLEKVDGGFYVMLLDQQQTDHVTVRTLQVSRDDEAGVDTSPRQVKHYEFQSWRMYEQCPWSSEGFIQMIEMIDRHLSHNLYVVPTEESEAEEEAAAGDRGGGGRPHHPPHPPPPPTVLVHCVDGASQCGLFVACYVVCQKMALDGQVDVFHSIQQMKRKRFHFVSSVEQYKYVFKILWEFVNTRMSV